MRFQSLRAIAFLGLVPAATGACGFIFSHAPPAGHEQMDYFTCTESNAAPIIDVIDVIWAFVIQSDIPIASRLVFAGLSGVADSASRASAGQPSVRGRNGKGRKGQVHAETHRPLTQ